MPSACGVQSLRLKPLLVFPILFPVVQALLLNDVAGIPDFTTLLKVTQIAQPNEELSIAILATCTKLITSHVPSRDALYQAQLCTSLLHFLHLFSHWPDGLVPVALVNAMFGCLDGVLEITDDLLSDFVVRGGVQSLCRFIPGPPSDLQQRAASVLRGLLTRPRLTFKTDAGQVASTGTIDAFEFFVAELQNAPDTASYTQALLFFLLSVQLEGLEVPAMQRKFADCGGLQALLTILEAAVQWAGAGGNAGAGPRPGELALFVEQVLAVLVFAIANSFHNRAFFCRKLDGYERLAVCLRQSLGGPLADYPRQVVQNVVNMAVQLPLVPGYLADLRRRIGAPGAAPPAADDLDARTVARCGLRVPTAAVLYDGDAARILLSFLPTLPEPLQCDILALLQALADEGPGNRAVMCGSPSGPGLHELLLPACAAACAPAVQEPARALLVQLLQFSVPPWVLPALAASRDFRVVLNRVARTPSAAFGCVADAQVPFVQLVPGTELSVPSIEWDAWPPAAGYAFSCWFCMEASCEPGKRSANWAFVLLRLMWGNCVLQLAVLPASGALVLRRGKDLHAFAEVAFRPGTWYHLVLSHERHILAPSELTLYVDGRRVAGLPAPYSSGAFSNSRAAPAMWPADGGAQATSAFIGTAPQHDGLAPTAGRCPEHLRWLLGPFALWDKALPLPAVQLLCALGPGHRQALQGDLLPPLAHDLLSSSLAPAWLRYLRLQCAAGTEVANVYANVPVGADGAALSGCETARELAAPLLAARHVFAYHGAAHASVMDSGADGARYLALLNGARTSGEPYCYVTGRGVLHMPHGGLAAQATRGLALLRVLPDCEAEPREAETGAADTDANGDTDPDGLAASPPEAVAEGLEVTLWLLCALREESCGTTEAWAGDRITASSARALRRTLPMLRGHSAALEAIADRLLAFAMDPPTGDGNEAVLVHRGAARLLLDGSIWREVPVEVQERMLRALCTRALTAPNPFRRMNAQRLVGWAGVELLLARLCDATLHPRVLVAVGDVLCAVLAVHCPPAVLLLLRDVGYGMLLRLGSLRSRVVLRETMLRDSNGDAASGVPAGGSEHSTPTVTPTITPTHTGAQPRGFTASAKPLPPPDPARDVSDSSAASDGSQPLPRKSSDLALSGLPGHCSPPPPPPLQITSSVSSPPGRRCSVPALHLPASDCSDTPRDSGVSSAGATNLTSVPAAAELPSPAVQEPLPVLHALPQPIETALRLCPLPRLHDAASVLLHTLYRLLHDGALTAAAVAEAFPVPWVLQYFAQAAHPIFVVLWAKTVAFLLITDAATATHFRAADGFGRLRVLLEPYCNQEELTYVFAALVVGRVVPPRGPLRAGQAPLEGLLDLGQAAGRSGDCVAFPDAIPVLLHLGRCMADWHHDPAVFPCLFTADYFDALPCGPWRARRHWRALAHALTVTRRLRHRARLARAPSAVVVGVPAAEQERRAAVLDGLVTFFGYLVSLCPKFAQACALLDVLQEAVAVLFTTGSLHGPGAGPPPAPPTPTSPGAATDWWIVATVTEEVGLSTATNLLHCPAFTMDIGGLALLETGTAHHILKFIAALIKASLAAPSASGTHTELLHAALSSYQLPEAGAAGGRLRCLYQHKLLEQLLLLLRADPAFTDPAHGPLSPLDQFTEFSVDFMLHSAAATCELVLEYCVFVVQRLVEYPQQSTAAAALGRVRRQLNRGVLLLFMAALAPAAGAACAVGSLEFFVRVYPTVLHPQNQSPEFLGCLCYALHAFLGTGDAGVRTCATGAWRLLVLTYPPEVLRGALPTCASIDLYDGFTLLRLPDPEPFETWLAKHEDALDRAFAGALRGRWLAQQDHYQKRAVRTLQALRTRHQQYMACARPVEKAYHMPLRHKRSLRRPLRLSALACIPQPLAPASSLFPAPTPSDAAAPAVRHALTPAVPYSRHHYVWEGWAELMPQLVPDLDANTTPACTPNASATPPLLLAPCDGPYRARDKLLPYAPDPRLPAGKLTGWVPVAEHYDGVMPLPDPPVVATDDNPSDPFAPHRHAHVHVSYHCFEGQDPAGPAARAVLERVLGPGERVVTHSNALRVQGMDATPALVLVTARFIVVLHSCWLDAAGRLHCNSRPESSAPAPPASAYLKLPLAAVTDVAKRRYKQRHVAIEVLLEFGSGLMVVLLDRDQQPSESDREAVYEALLRLCARQLPRHHPGVDMGLWKTWRAGVTRRWLAWELSNYEYLLHLNQLAGRTPNDLNQYPVFPWVLADYTSATLDLADPAVYRDLAKPMGAQDPARAERFRARYEEWCDPATPPFHYGSHYSSAGVVLHYLLRLQPFAGLNVCYQDGRLDIPSRLFYSVAGAWEGASAGGMANVKELLPEFYSVPDFLFNVNDIDMGQHGGTGERLNHVLLPPWARGDPARFVALQRQALEHEHVSLHLHHWIDLVFGYKQQGEEAVRALNVFHHLTYEAGVAEALRSAPDATTRAAIMAQMTHFGRTPNRLFLQPHPRRNAPVACAPVPTCIGGGAAAAAARTASGGFGATGTGVPGSEGTAASSPVKMQLGDLQPAAPAPVPEAAPSDEAVVMPDSPQPQEAATNGGSADGSAAPEAPAEGPPIPAPDSFANLTPAAAVGAAAAAAAAIATAAAALEMRDWRWRDVTRYVFVTRPPAPSDVHVHPTTMPLLRFPHALMVTDQGCHAATTLSAWLITARRPEYLQLSGYMPCARLYSGKDHALIAHIPVPVDDPLQVTCMAASPSGSIVLLGSTCGTIHVMRMDRGDGTGESRTHGPSLQPLGRLIAHTHPVAALLLSPDHCLALSTTRHAADPPMLWHCTLTAIVPVRRLSDALQGEAVTCEAIHAATGHVALATSSGAVTIWDGYGRPVARAPPPSTPHDRAHDITAVAVLAPRHFTATQRLLATGHRDGSVRLLRYDCHRPYQRPYAPCPADVPPLNPVTLVACLTGDHIPHAGGVTCFAGNLVAGSAVHWHGKRFRRAHGEGQADHPPSVMDGHEYLYYATQMGLVICLALPGAALHALLPAAYAGAAPESAAVAWEVP